MSSEMVRLFSDLRSAQGWSIAAAIFAITACALVAWLSAYTKRKGELFATKEDFAELLQQTAKTTAITEQIRSQISQGAVVGRSELEYRKAQLAEFYGPIYARLKISRDLYGLWMAGKVSAINREVIALFRRQNEAITEIITTKAHLINGPEIPPVFTRFMTAVTIWNYFTARPDQPFVEPDVAALPEAAFPQDFADYIFSETQTLKARLDQLHRKYSIGDSGSA